MDFIDAHPHVIAADRERYPFSPLSGTVPDWVLSGLPVEGYAQELDAAGIGRAVLVQGSMGYGFNNNYVADSAAAHRDRFAGVGAIDLGAPDTPDRMTYWARERGLVGFRAFLTAPGMGEDAFAILDEPRTFGVWETARALGVPMKLQIRSAAFPRVARLAARFPDVDIIIDHFAMTVGDELFALAAHPRVNLLVSDHVIRAASAGEATPQPFLERVVGTFGAERILWGSNFPSSKGPVRDLLALAQRTFGFLPEHDRAAIFAGTALRLYPALAR